MYTYWFQVPCWVSTPTTVIIIFVYKTGSLSGSYTLLNSVVSCKHPFNGNNSHTIDVTFGPSYMSHVRTTNLHLVSRVKQLCVMNSDAIIVFSITWFQLSFPKLYKCVFMLDVPFEQSALIDWDSFHLSLLSFDVMQIDLMKSTSSSTASCVHTLPLKDTHWVSFSVLQGVLKIPDRDPTLLFYILNACINYCFKAIHLQHYSSYVRLIAGPFNTAYCLSEAVAGSLLEL